MNQQMLRHFHIVLNLARSLQHTFLLAHPYGGLPHWLIEMYWKQNTVGEQSHHQQGG